MRPNLAYDFWRETVFYDFEADRLEKESKHSFHGHVLGLISPRGNFYVYDSHGISGRRTPAQIRRDGNTGIDLGLVLSGVRHHQSDNGTVTKASKGELFVYDPTRPSRVSWSNHRGLHLKLGREAVQAAVGQNVPSEDVLARLLQESRLWPFLRAQMMLLAEQLHTLSRLEQSILLEGTIDIALTAVSRVVSNATSQRQTLKDQSGKQNIMRRHGLFIAAKQYIKAHLSDPELTIEDIAGAIGCSRATLYRAFTDHGVPVAEYIREQRLLHFSRLLQNARHDDTIRALAYQSGIRNPARMTKWFRARFGCSPDEALRMPIIPSMDEKEKPD